MHLPYLPSHSPSRFQTRSRVSSVWEDNTAVRPLECGGGGSALLHYRGHLVQCSALVSPEGECFPHAAIGTGAGDGYEALLTATEACPSRADAVDLAWREARRWIDRHQPLPA